MSYCYVWKKENRVYMIAESAISSKADLSSDEVSTFGEKQGKFGGYYVCEGQLKILKIRDDIVIAFAGDIKHAGEVIYNICANCADMPYESIRDILIANITHDTEMVLVKGGERPQILLIKDDEQSVVESCELGVGQENEIFSQYVRELTDSLYKEKVDPNHYLACVIGCIQCHSVAQRLIVQGFGGTYYGMFIGAKVNWFRDLEYYLFNDDIRDGKTISVIARESSVFSSSDISQSSVFMLHKAADGSLWESQKRVRAIKKSLDTKNAFYYFFYSFKYNCILFVIAKGEGQNGCYKRWIHRGRDEVYYAYAFDPVIVELMQKLADPNSILPKLIYLPERETPYMFHNQVADYCNEDDVRKTANPYNNMDFDFEQFRIQGYDLPLLYPVKRNVLKYDNVLLIDFKFFCNIIEDRVKLYSPFRSMSVEGLALDNILKSTYTDIIDRDFRKYLVVFHKNKNESIFIENIDMENMFRAYENCVFVLGDGKHNSFQGTLFYMIKNYYLNDKFFHINKMIVVADDSQTNAMLWRILPEYNLEDGDPDIVLIRNINALSAMTIPLKYFPIDPIVSNLFDISSDEFLKLESLAFESGAYENMGYNFNDYD